MPIKHSTTKKSTRKPVVSPSLERKTPNKNKLYKIAGCLSEEDTVELKTIIENGCERIDQDAWKNLH
jgi:hypothetical protein